MFQEHNKIRLRRDTNGSVFIQIFSQFGRQFFQRPKDNPFIIRRPLAIHKRTKGTGNLFRPPMIISETLMQTHPDTPTTD